MDFESEVVIFIAKTFYDMSPVESTIKPLCGYTDRNFIFATTTGHKLVLKIVHEKESIEPLTDIVDEVMEKASRYSNESFLIPKPLRTCADKFSATTTLRGRDVKTKDHRDVVCNIKLFEYYPGITLDEFQAKNPGLYQNRELYFRLGKLCGELCRYNKTNCHLIDKLKQQRLDTKFVWSTLDAVDNVLNELAPKLYPNADHERRLIIDKIVKEFDEIKSKVYLLPQYVIHADLNGANILIHEEYLNPTQNSNYRRDNFKFCLIDFQDIQVGPQILELAIMMIYNVLQRQIPDYKVSLVEVGRWILEGYQSSPVRIDCKETLLLIPTLMKLRLAQSLLIGLDANKEDPSNDYVMKTNVNGWKLLSMMLEENSVFSNPNQLVNLWLYGRP